MLILGRNRLYQRRIANKTLQNAAGIPCLYRKTVKVNNGALVQAVGCANPCKKNNLKRGKSLKTAK